MYNLDSKAVSHLALDNLIYEISDRGYAQAKAICNDYYKRKHRYFYCWVCQTYKEDYAKEKGFIAGKKLSETDLTKSYETIQEVLMQAQQTLPHIMEEVYRTNMNYIYLYIIDLYTLTDRDYIQYVTGYDEGQYLLMRLLIADSIKRDRRKSYRKDLQSVKVINNLVLYKEEGAYKTTGYLSAINACTDCPNFRNTGDANIPLEPEGYTPVRMEEQGIRKWNRRHEAHVQ